ncbi:MAG: response regulator transcription factor [Oscillospiraceae bacterium]
MLVQTAAAYEKLGKRREATELLRQAAALAQPDGLVTPLAESGRYLRELLPEYGTLGREAAELSRVLENGSRAARQQEQRPEVFDPLTEREWAVAQRMARRLSNREIAGQLFLTEGTVKQYINQIYSKLHLTGDARTKRRRLEELMGE